MEAVEEAREGAVAQVLDVSTYIRARSRIGDDVEERMLAGIPFGLVDLF